MSPITWTHHLVWIVPILAWLTWGLDRPAFGPMWATLAAMIFWDGFVWYPWHVPVNPLYDRSPSYSLVDILINNSYFILMIGFLFGVATLLAVRRLTSPVAQETGIDAGG